MSSRVISFFFFFFWAFYCENFHTPRTTERKWGAVHQSWDPTTGVSLCLVVSELPGCPSFCPSMSYPVPSDASCRSLIWSSSVWFLVLKVTVLHNEMHIFSVSQILTNVICNLNLSALLSLRTFPLAPSQHVLAPLPRHSHWSDFSLRWLLCLF